MTFDPEWPPEYFNMFRMSQGSFLVNLSSIGACWKFDLWPMNFDLWGQNHHSYSALVMCHQYVNFESAPTHRGLDIGNFVHLTPFYQPSPMTLNDYWHPICDTLVNIGQVLCISATGINVLCST